MTDHTNERPSADLARLNTVLAEDPRQRARRVLPGGYGRSTYMVGGDVPYAVRGEGFRVWDDTGRELIDLNNNFTTLIHGHAHPALVEAAAEELGRGSSFGLPSEPEIKHAEALLARLPHADLIRYTNSGTEAVMTALRLARAHTGRPRTLLVRQAYHGHSDVVLPAGGPKASRGVPPSLLAESTIVPINDVAALGEAIERAGGELAAVLLDLSPNRAGLIAADPAYVETLVALCREHSILLIIDEVVSFRLGVAGLTGAYGLMPDLVVLGKLIGGGLPVGAVAGRTEIMSEFDPAAERALEHGGTFSGNPVTMAAGLAALELYDGSAIARLNRLGDEMRTTLAQRLSPLGWEVRGTGSLLRPWPSTAEPQEVAKLHRALWWAGYHRGVLLNPTGLVALCTVMDDDAVELSTAQLAAAVEDVAEGFRAPA